MLFTYLYLRDDAARRLQIKSTGTVCSVAGHLNSGVERTPSFSFDGSSRFSIKHIMYSTIDPPVFLHYQLWTREQSQQINFNNLIKVASTHLW